MFPIVFIFPGADEAKHPLVGVGKAAYNFVKRMRNQNLVARREAHHALPYIDAIAEGVEMTVDVFDKLHGSQIGIRSRTIMGEEELGFGFDKMFSYPECRVHHGLRTNHKTDDRAVSGIEDEALLLGQSFKGLKDKMIQPRLPLQLQLMAMRGVINDVEKENAEQPSALGARDFGPLVLLALVPIQHGHGFHQAAVHPVEGTRQGGNFIFAFGRKLWDLEVSLADFVGRHGKPAYRTYYKNIEHQIQDQKNAESPTAISDVIRSRKDFVGHGDRQRHFRNGNDLERQ